MARIRPLNGEYRGTIVEFEDDQNGNQQITVWTPNHFAMPFVSERELARGWPTEIHGHDHVEDVQSYKIAQIICEALTQAGY